MKAWISAFRLRTLPLSLSPIIVGTLLAAGDNAFSWQTTVWALLTTLFLQVLSNLANDYGDGVKGTDNEERIGPARAIQSGAISQQAMKKALYVFGVLSFASGMVLLYVSLTSLTEFLVFLGMGVLAIWAAIAYTVGKNAYGYRGLGDVFVLLFFGWMGAVGTYYLSTNSLSGLVFLPATSVGFLAVAVLNLNNMRDRISDEKAGKRTLAVLLGDRRARVYHTLLLMFSLLLTLLFTLQEQLNIYKFIFVVIAIPIALQLKKVWSVKQPEDFDPMLKQTALTAFLFALTFGIGQVL